MPSQSMIFRGANPGHGQRSYPNAIKGAPELLDNIRSSGLTKVRIVGGSHKADQYEKSRVYAGCIAEAIRDAGFSDTTLQIEGHHPEVDFYYISHAKHLVVSAGGYSNIMGNLARMRYGNDTIIGRSFGITWR